MPNSKVGEVENTSVIVSEKAWNQSMADNLNMKRGFNFRLIDEPKVLTLEILEQIKPRFVFFPHWSVPIASQIFDQFECVVFHMTDLPFGRGGTPLQNLISRGFTETKISALKCTSEIDAGPIYLKRDLSLHGSAQEIYERASLIIEDMICEIVRGEIEPIAQVGTPLIFNRRTPEQGSLDSCRSIDEVFDVIRMLDADGYPHAFIEIGKFICYFREAVLGPEGVTSKVQIIERKDYKEVMDER